MGSNVSVRQYTQGTFIVDMIDPVKLRSVWRSIIESRMRSQTDPEQAAENRRAAAEEAGRKRSSAQSGLQEALLGPEGEDVFRSFFAFLSLFF